jgi:hypothetical protein
MHAVAGDELRDELRFLRLWRLIAIGTDTALIAFTVVVDTLGRLYVDPMFRVSEFLFGALVSAWLVLLGLEGISLLRRVRDDHGQ